MPEATPLPITPPPGIVKTEGARVIEGRWSDAQWVRFQNGRPQKRGGHTRQTSVATSGVPRALHAWRDLSQQEGIQVYADAPNEPVEALPDRPILLESPGRC